MIDKFKICPFKIGDKVRIKEVPAYYLEGFSGMTGTIVSIIIGDEIDLGIDFGKEVEDFTWRLNGVLEKDTGRFFDVKYVEHCNPSLVELI